MRSCSAKGTAGTSKQHEGKKNVSPNPFHNKTKPFKPCTETKSPISNAILAVKKVRRSPISASGVSHNKETPMGYLILRGMKSMFSDDSARVGTYDPFYGYGTVGTVGAVGTVRWVRWVRYGGYRYAHTVPTVPYPPYLPYRTHRTYRTVPTVPTDRTHRTHCTVPSVPTVPYHPTVPPYPRTVPFHRALLLKFDKR